jgi:hypothetical protein
MGHHPDETMGSTRQVLLWVARKGSSSNPDERTGVYPASAGDEAGLRRMA